MATKTAKEINEETTRNANLLLSVLQSHSYQTTIGAWLREKEDNAMSVIATLDRSEENANEKLWQAQAAIKVIRELNLRIDTVVSRGREARKSLGVEEKPL